MGSFRVDHPGHDPYNYNPFRRYEVPLKLDAAVANEALKELGVLAATPAWMHTEEWKQEMRDYRKWIEKVYG